MYQILKNTVSNYVNNEDPVIATLGRPLSPGRNFWTWGDRLCAWTLMLTTFACVLTWPSAGPGDPRNYVSAALALTCIVAYPSSKTCEVTGRMESFLYWHSVWHYMPCALAIVWFYLSIV